MSAADEIRSLTRRAELLAPAGRWDALVAVLEAGADAVYLGLKRFNMRLHRSDLNFTEAELSDALELAHAWGRRIYVTLNALLGEKELAAARRTLRRLSELGVDAIIVQDLATIQLAGELGLDLPLHASTMMNVHHPEQALALKNLGLTRIITSRDIDVRAAAEIGRLADIEVEYFVHGDMCAAQSGQCSMSGVLFGKSANRGECMKPCRWEYELVSREEGDGGTRGSSVRAVARGHLLAIKDLFLLRHVPDLIQGGICGLKIEGRMREAAYLRQLVGAYRRALDLYYDCPPAYSLNVAALEQELYAQRVREVSTLTTLGAGSRRSMFDSSGRSEPLFLSSGCAETRIEDETLEVEAAPGAAPADAHRVELSVSVGCREAAEAAIAGGADRLYLAAELSQSDRAPWSPADLVELIERAHARGAKVGLRTPRITTEGEWMETHWLLRQLADHRPDYILVHHLGTMRLARAVCPDIPVIADYGFNVLNSAAAAVLARLGAAQVTFSNEGGLADLAALAENVAVPLEILAHGPIAGMLLEHCVIAMYASGAGRKDVCRGPCRHLRFGLRDRAGQVRPILADQHCRNHLFAAHDLAIFPRLDAFLYPAVRSIRIDGQLYSSTWLARVVRAYRSRLDAAGVGEPDADRFDGLWQRLRRASPRALTFGPYARSIVQSRSTAKVMREVVNA